jgi:murein DD-endopeptidase MepM/ murein hydrolase activator NlpD
LQTIFQGKIYMYKLLPLVIFFFTLSGKLFPQYLAPQAGGEFQSPTDKCVCLSEEERQRIIADNKKTADELIAQGKITLQKTLAVSFVWPLKQASNLNDYSYYGISNFVDHNPNIGQLLDYNNGARTYDIPGYNHKGTDIFTWPFGWYKMDNSQVEIIAGADGVIIGKDNGSYDRNCGFNSNNWNAVYLMHADGSTSWYGHMKNNSLTTKGVGQNVSAGEYLGIVGSSGSSTGPHLHLEIYDSGNNLIDPWFGPGNPTINSSWWQNQKPYFDPKVNKIATHSNWPAFPSCPQQEILNIKNNFVSNETVYFVTYYQDQLNGMNSSYQVSTPDNLVWYQWNHSIPDSFYEASYWGWSINLPPNAAQGNWRFSVVFNGWEYSHTFQVNVPNAVGDENEIPNRYFISDNYPNPFNPVTKINYSIPHYDLVTIKLYDVLGNEVRTLENNYKLMGNYDLVIDAGGLRSGVYFVSFNAGKFRETKKIVLAK